MGKSKYEYMVDMKLLLILLILIFSIGTSQSASLDNLSADLNNGAYISIPYNLTYDGTFNITTGTLQISVNDSSLTWNTSTNKTLTSIDFNTTFDTYSFIVSGTSGYLNFSAIMASANTSYTLSSGESKNTQSDKSIWFNYTGSYPVTLTVSKTVSIPIDSSTGSSGTSTPTPTPVATVIVTPIIPYINYDFPSIPALVDSISKTVKGAYPLKLNLIALILSLLALMYIKYKKSKNS